MNATDSKTTTLQIEGMTCPSCRKHVTNTLGRVPGVLDVEVDLGRGEACVVHVSTLDASALAHAVEAAGYHAVPRANGGAR